MRFYEVLQVLRDLLDFQRFWGICETFKGLGGFGGLVNMFLGFGGFGVVSPCKASSSAQLRCS